jgi:hypothetical protein
VPDTVFVPVVLPDGTTIHVEATPIGSGEMNVADRPLPFTEFTKAVEGIASSFTSSLKRLGPNRASVELALEAGVQAGQLTALLVKGSGKASMKIVLEWDIDNGRRPREDREDGAEPEIEDDDEVVPDE